MKNQSGMTLIEALVSFLILCIVSVGALSIMPAVRTQQKDEDIKAVGRKVILDAMQSYKQIQFAPLFIEQGGSPIVWVSCFDVNGNPLGVGGTSFSDPKAYTYTNATQPMNNIPGACSNAPKTVELHAWLESDNRIRRLRFLALARISNGSVVPIQGDSHVTSN